MNDEKNSERCSALAGFLGFLDRLAKGKDMHPIVWIIVMLAIPFLCLAAAIPIFLYDFFHGNMK